MSYRLGKRSRTRLAGVNPDLVVVVSTAITMTDIDFGVIEGRRSLERQKKLVANGASKTMNSRHLTGHAVDLAPYVDGKFSWHWPHYHILKEAMFAASDYCDIPLRWGGDWNGNGLTSDESFPDGPHWELPWSSYPLKSF